MKIQFWALIFLLTACQSLAPNEKSLDLPLATAFQGSNLLLSSNQEPKNDEIDQIDVFDPKFWDQFGDQVLTDLLAVGLKQNQDIEIAYSRLLQALAVTGQKESSLFPSIDLNVKTPIQRLSLEDPSIRAFSRFPQFQRTQHNYRPEAVFTWEIDFFGTKRFAVQEAHHKLQSAKANLVASQLSIITQITQSYLNVRSVQQRMKLIEDLISYNQELLKINQAKANAGLSNETQLLQIELQINQNQSQHLKLNALLSGYLRTLSSLTALSPQALFEKIKGNATFPKFRFNPKKAIPSELLKRRPDLISAEYKLKASAWAIASASAEKFPKFNLSASTALLSGSLSNLLSADALFANVLPGMSWRVLDFGYLDALVNVKKAEEREALAQYKKTVIDAFAEAESSIMIMEIKSFEQKKAMEGKGLQEKLLEIRDVQYQRGIGDFGAVLEQQKALQQAQELVLLSEEEYLIAVINTYKALGGGWHVLRLEGE